MLKVFRVLLLLFPLLALATEAESKKVEDLRQELSIRFSEHKNQLINYYLERNKTDSEITEKIADSKEIKIYEYLLAELNKDEVQNFELLEQIASGLKVRGGLRPIRSIFNYAENLLQEHTVKKRSGKSIDDSDIDPDTDDRFWENLDIPSINVKDRYRGKNVLFDGLKIKFPKKGKFKKVRKTQTKPKIDFTATVDGVKRKFKLKVGAEMHSEITAGALATSLGYYADISKMVEDFELTLPKSQDLEDLKREWNSYFDAYDFDDYVSKIEKDKKDRVVITFKKALIETKPKELLRVGPWYWGKEDNENRREVKGLYLFNIWISNNDVKEGGNNKIVLKNFGKENMSAHFYQHDIGFSFGQYFREKPVNFGWSAVKSFNKNSVTFNYWPFQENTGFDHVEYNDAKWMVRKIAKLSKKQIKKAVKLGGWPKEVEKLLIEKLASRRNSLVKAFYLEDEYDLLDVERNISTENKVLNNGELTQYEFDDYAQSFGPELFDVMNPVYEVMKDLSIEAAKYAAKNFDRFEVNGDKFGYNNDLIADIEVSIDRDIVENPKKFGQDDNYLVEDTVKVRFGIGAGIMVRGKLNYIKEYKIIYPVKEKKDGRFKNGFIFNAMLPYQVETGKLPENYILILTDSFEGEGEVLLGESGVPLNYELSKTRGFLTRRVISHFKNDVNIYVDNGPYSAIVQEIYADLLILRIPIWKFPDIDGHLSRKHYKLSFLNDKALSALSAFYMNGSEKGLNEITTPSYLTTDFESSPRNTDFFSLFKSKNSRRYDEIEENERDYVQVQHINSSEWNFLGDGELKENNIRLTSEVIDSKIENPYMHLEFKISDKTASTAELKYIYLALTDRLSKQKNFLNFTPELFSFNEFWGHLKLKINLGFDKNALNKILNIEPSYIFEELGRRTVYSKNFWKRRFYKHNDHGVKKYKFRLKYFFNQLRKAKHLESDKEKWVAIADGLDEMIFMGRGAFNTLFLEILLDYLGRDNYYLKAKITVPSDQEMILPSGKEIVRELNPDLKVKQKKFLFEFETIEDIWKLFREDNDK